MQALTAKKHTVVDQLPAHTPQITAGQTPVNVSAQPITRRDPVLDMWDAALTSAFIPEHVDVEIQEIRGKVKQWHPDPTTAPPPDVRPVEQQASAEPTDPVDPTKGSCKGPVQISKKYSLSEFITRNTQFSPSKTF